MDGTQLQDRLARVREQMEAAARRAGRDADDVALVAVTKGHPLDVARAAIAVGLTRLGENRVHELETKRAELGDEAAAVDWHLIGHLQRNKARTALAVASLLHSLDSLRLAEVLAREAERAGVRFPVLVQVNASGEETKGGFPVETVEEAVAKIVKLPTLRVRGLMTMAPYTDDARVLRGTFRRTKEAFDRCAALADFEARHLSMGMSNDFEIAIEEGSTLVRLGTTLFGERVR